MSAKRNIERLLKPGWTVRPSGHLFVILDPNGQSLRDDAGREIRVNIHTWAGSSAEKFTIDLLRRRGAIAKSPPPRRRRKAMEEHKPKVIKAATNPILLSQGILADPKSTGRERQLAREYLALTETHRAVRKLAQVLGERLTEAHERLDENT